MAQGDLIMSRRVDVTDRPSIRPAGRPTERRQSTLDAYGVKRSSSRYDRVQSRWWRLLNAANPKRNNLEVMRSTSTGSIIGPSSRSYGEEPGPGSSEVTVDEG